ncbi:hypothetical protein HXX76_006854 [Chlamydomonas incerta]|uniref:BTB domain-containing protein n=1 Tax=Chlamydomonas incerta TaxID=51695 RepID=A0A835SYG5_CHLIN|nr:hypothetical protein HXX76_006854 [Chlamydomonas incerta]|eukprot:KAG2435652.1 hypothetical protein HXX76_006854 [Chlamydomonas incerta]
MLSSSVAPGEEGGRTPADHQPKQLNVDGASQDWEVVLPLLYPRMSPPRLDWAVVRRVIVIAKKYQIRLLRSACERFLEEAQLSANSADPNYVLTWLQISEQLELGGLFSKCLKFLDSHLLPRAPGLCDYCGTRSHIAAAGTSDSHSGCSCACAICGEHTLRHVCRCGRDFASVPPAGRGSSSTAGDSGAAYGHGYATAAAYTSPTAGGGAVSGGGGGGGGGRAYLGMAAPLAAAYEATARARYAAAVPALAGGPRRDLELLYRRDGAAAPRAAPAASALRIQVHAPTAAALAQRYASPLPARVHISVGSSGSSSGAASTGRGALTSPIAGSSAAYVSPPAPLRVLKLVKGDSEHLLKLSVPTLVELLGML